VLGPSPSSVGVTDTARLGLTAGAGFMLRFNVWRWWLLPHLAKVHRMDEGARCMVAFIPRGPVAVQDDFGRMPRETVLLGKEVGVVGVPV